MHEMFKQLAKIIKPMVFNEMHLVQQQQMEMSHVQGHLTEAMHGIISETVHVATTYT